MSVFAISIAAQLPPAVPHIVVFHDWTPFASFASAVDDEREDTNPTAWGYLDRSVLGTVQTLEAQFAMRSDHVYSAAVRGFSARLTQDQVEALLRLPFVASIEPDVVISPVDEVTAGDAAARTDANVYVIAALPPVALDGIDRVNVTDPHCPETPRITGASVTFVNVGWCRPGALRTSAVLKGVDWVTASAKKPAIVRMRAGASPDKTLNAALTRSVESGLTYVGAGDQPTASGAERTASTAMLPASVMAASSGGAVYNLKVVSDSYPDLSDVKSLVGSSTSRWPSNAAKVWALFYWSHILKRQTPPMVLHGREVTDPIRNFTDYGFTMCSTVSGINQTLHELLGLRHQFWDICNHSVSQVEYDGKFRLIDSSMSHLVTTDGVTLASLQEAAADSARLVRERSLYATSPNGFLTGSDTLRNLTDVVNPETGGTFNSFSDAFCETGLKFRDYFYNWDSGHRYVLNLRDDESYTRYYRRLGTTSDYWVGSESVSAPDPAKKFEIDAVNRFGIRGNGRWTFSPSLAADTYAGAVYKSSNVTAASSGGLTPAVPGQPAEVIYKVQAANAITSQKIQAQFARADALATGKISVSLNHGATWVQVAALGSTIGGAVPLTVNLRDQVTGAYETLVRIQMTAPSGSPEGIRLTGLRIDTLTQVNTKALPALNVGRNEIFVGLGDRTDTMVLWPELRGDLWKKDVYASSNIASQSVNMPRPYTAVVYPAVLSQDASLTYRMDAPTDITRFTYGGRLHNYAAGSYIDFLHSFDKGATWIRSYRLSDVTKPWDVVHYETITNVPAGVRTVMFKFLFHNTCTTATRATGLYAARMEVNHGPAAGAARPVDVTWRWKEVSSNRTLVERSHKQRVTEFPTKYVVNVGGSDHPVMESLTVSLDGSGDATPYGYSDGIDKGGQKYAHRKQTVGTNLAVRRPYTFSRAPSGFQRSAAASNTTILTDGIVGAPMTGGVSYWWGQCWSSGSNVDVALDLATLRTVRAFRAHLFGYPSWDALKGQVQDRVEVLTSADGVNFASRGFLQTSLWKKDVPINHMLQDDERATGWNFELVTAPLSARYVTYRMTPKRDLCVSELQVLDRLDYQPFDIRIALPDGGGSVPGDGEPPSVALTSPAAGATVSGSVPVAATAADNVGVTRVEFLVNGMVVGSDTVSPYAVTWNSSSVANGSATLTALAADAAGNTSTSQVIVTVANAPPNGAQDIVLYAARATVVTGAWQVESSASAAGGSLIRHPNAGVPRPTAPLASPLNYFELTFRAEANVPYHLWLRGKADSNSWANDSVWVQFSNVTAYPLATTQATTVTLENCTNCGVSGWGWQDNGFGLNVLGPHITFTTTGLQTVRIQTREDGLAIDQIILSPSRFLTTAPGALKGDTTIYPPTDGSVPGDTTAPTVALTAPTAGQTISGTVSLSAAAADNVGVTRVEFRVNGAAVGSDTASPYSITWNSSGVANGSATLTALAADAAGNTSTSQPVTITVANAPSTGAQDIVLYAARATVVAGAWRVESSASAAGGSLIRHPNADVPRLTAPLASPVNYFELTFRAEANVPYHLWLRGTADSNSWANDSVWVQFSNVTAYPIATTIATTVTLENCISCGVSGWGWQDNGFGLNVLGPHITFTTTGLQTMRIQTREDGLAIDQIILSPSRFLTAAPGALKGDTTIYPATSPE